ncbi:4-coumarate--CoA ligase 1-like [Coccinella septempunctata]|uniref:4-coumarate--CoA ligase 1-like n=1 Tax=Coccinella septempunctata TaxID=41139 RepID=UPI001D06E259|nr:4-coumarate--CoA ligase 1-like [Coccinella septempunctata]
MSENHEYIIKMPEENPVPEYGLGYEIFHQMKLREDEIAQFMVETDESVTFGELLDESIRVAINLKKIGVAADDIVAISSWNNKHTCVPYIAGLFNGSIVTFLDPLVVPSDKAFMLRKVTPKILFVDEDNLENIKESLRLGELNIKIIVIGKDPSGYISFDEFLNASKQEIKDFQPVKIEDNERTAVIVFSSGTTGVPKGICLSHLGILSRTSGYTLPVFLIFTSPNWISYILVLIKCLRLGGARVLSKFYDMSQIWRMIDKYKINILIASVYQCCQLIKHPIEDGINVSSLGLIMISGATLPLEIYNRMKKVIPNPIILQAYGLTEGCGPSLVFDLGRAEEREWQKNKPESCGTPIPGIWYKVVDPETEKILGPNKPGELRLKTKFAMVGYYNEESSKDFDSDGYLKTGDIVQYDEDRCFYVVDRIREMLKYKGNVVSPTALESILATHPSVDIAAVIGLPHVEDGDHPLGIVKLRSNCTATPEELVEYAYNKIADKIQRLWAGVKIVDDLPVNGTGKIHKRKLRDMVMAGKI